MKEAPYQYFEISKKGGLPSRKTYEEASLTMGRICLDVGFVVDNQLVLVERNKPPMQGLWLSGGRIRWENFTNIFDYASQTMREHFGIASSKNKMTLLKPRLFCFQERPYPEVVFWIIGSLTKKQFSHIKLDTGEQSQFFLFASKKELQLYMRKAKLTTVHRSIIADLWDELVEKKLLSA